MLSSKQILEILKRKERISGHEMNEEQSVAVNENDWWDSKLIYKTQRTLSIQLLEEDEKADNWAEKNLKFSSFSSPGISGIIDLIFLKSDFLCQSVLIWLSRVLSS